MLFVYAFSSQVIVLLPFVYGALDYKNLTYQMQQDESEITRIITFPECGEGEKLLRCLKQYIINLKKLTNLVYDTVEAIKNYARSLHKRDGPIFFYAYVHPYKIKKGSNWTQKEFKELERLIVKCQQWYDDFRVICNIRLFWFNNINLKEMADLGYAAYT